MALNTPKRVKIFNTFIQSPGSDHNGEWQNDDDDDESVNKSASAVINRSDATNSSNGIGNGNGSLSPVSSCDSPEFPLRNNSNNSSNVSANSSFNTTNGSDTRENRRGRPRSEALTTLMIEGSTSPSSIKCTFCNRVFPREKSLQAHLRTHTGERPYACDYPGCTRAFTQSGQLKTHQRLHTGERPFMCVRPKCQMRFTHANRHCPEHPYDQLKRCDDFVIQAVTEQNYDVIKWLEKYKMEKEDRTPTRKTPKRMKTSSSDDITMRHSSSNENFNIGRRSGGSDENKFPVTPSNPYKSRKGLMVELDMNAGLGASPITGTKMKPTPKMIRWQEPLSQEEDSADEFEMPAQSTFNPKKRWLREAWQNDLAKPLESTTVHHNLSFETRKSYDKFDSSPYQLLSPPKQTVLAATATTTTTTTTTTSMSNTNNSQMNPNQLRPTVLMVAAKNRTMPLLNLSSTKNNDASQFTHEHHQQQQQQQQSTSTKLVSTLNSPINCHDSQRSNIENDMQIDRSNVIASTPITSANQKMSMNRSSKNSFSSSNRNNNSNSTTTSSTTAAAAAGKSQQWLGALALMELASDENNPVSSSMPIFYENTPTN